MTSTDLLPRTGENLLATYLALGRELPEAEIRESESYVALLSGLPHPSGNFASRLRLDPWSAGELRALAAERPTFQAVALADDGPAHLPELLRRAGFRDVLRLVTMVAEPQRGVDVAFEMIECFGQEARARAGRFMADTFFARESETLRETMAEAMAKATSLSLYMRTVRERPTAAVALVRTAGLVGVYNLCVSGAQRGKGIGSSVVAWCHVVAAAEGLPMCLQCVPTLEPWYARHGFTRLGVVTVWSVG